MFATGFSMAPERIAEAPDGPSAQFLVEQAAEHGVWLCGSIAVDDPARTKPVNRSCSPVPTASATTTTRSTPSPTAASTSTTTPATSSCTVDVEGVRCSFFVCYDLRFADEFWALADRTDCYVVVANWPAARRAPLAGLLGARAIENQA